PLWARTVVVVSADHGEAFGEHQQHFHGGWAFQELLHVPLVIRVPNQMPRVEKEVVSLIDLSPTILDLFGVDTPGSIMGQSLVPLLRGGRASFQRPVAFYTTKGQYGFVFPDLVKVLYTPKQKRREVYDLKNDPTEQHNLSDDDESSSERLRLVRSFF